MAGWHHLLDGHEFEQALGVGDGQGSLECCNPWGHKESDKTERLHCTELIEFPGESAVKNLPAMQERWVWSLRKKDCLEKEMATNSVILAEKSHGGLGFLQTSEEPGGLQSMGHKQLDRTV